MLLSLAQYCLKCLLRCHAYLIRSRVHLFTPRNNAIPAWVAESYSSPYAASVGITWENKNKWRFPWMTPNTVCSLVRCVTPSSPMDSWFALSQWETSLQSNAVSHWLSANLESALDCGIRYARSLKRGNSVTPDGGFDICRRFSGRGGASEQDMATAWKTQFSMIGRATRLSHYGNILAQNVRGSLNEMGWVIVS